MKTINRKTIICTALFAAFSLAGCANLTSIDRTTSTKGAKAIHLDAKQRIVMTKEDGKIFCAEPNPDALSAFASSFGGGAAVPNTASVSIATALSEGVGSIGLRTQSITLLRDSLFRVCEAGYNGHIGRVMTGQLHERFQDVTLALLAVEQLTGAVVAQQVLLTGQANASASAAVLDAERYLREAEERERMAAEKVDRSQQAVEDQRAVVAAKQAAYDNGPCTGGTIEPTEATREQCERQQNELNEATAELSKAEARLAKDMDASDRAAENRMLAAQARDVATSSAEAEASNAGQFSGGTTGSTINEKTVEHIAKAVTEIVTTVVNKDHARDSCLVIISEIVSRQVGIERAQERARTLGRALPEPTLLYKALGMESPDEVDDVVKFCAELIQKDDA